MIMELFVYSLLMFVFLYGVFDLSWTIIHELTHYHYASKYGEVKEICFMGWNYNLNAIGWVTSNQTWNEPKLFWMDGHLESGIRGK